MKSKGFAGFPLIILIVVLLFAGLVYAITVSDRHSYTAPIDPPHSVIGPDGPDPNPSPRTYQLNLSTIEDDKISPLDEIKGLETNGFTNTDPFYDQENSLYLPTSKKVVKYALDTKKTTDVYQISTSSAQIAHVISSKDNLFVTESEGEGGCLSQGDTIYEKNMKTQKVRKVGSKEPVYCGSLRYLFKSQDADIIASFGGDGCGGYGIIYKVKNGEFTEIAKTGAGCVSDPRYIGFNEENQSIILANLKNPNQPYSGDSNYKYDVLYYKNVNTLAVESLVDLKGFDQGIISIFPDDTTSNIAIISDKQLSVFNLANKSITKKTALKSSDFHYPTLLGNKFYFRDNQNSSFKILNLNDGIQSILVNSSQSSGYGEPMVLGLWHQKPLLYLIYNPSP